ncbi:MAG: nucleotide exchange factor GrpE [Verrucomicrobia bacterium]|nr:MAG: nucleotide exchange factor GrpE [Verrucomicrobiota bacterium]
MSAKENKHYKLPEPAPPGEAAEPVAPADELPAGRTAAESESDSAPLTMEQIQELKTKAAKADEHWERLLRTTADLENYKKRAARERQDAVRFANAALLEKLIPALDHFDMALTAANNTEGNPMESLKTGIAMVYNQLKNALTEAGLEEIDAAGQPFDPNLHEAVSQEDSTDVPEGHVIRQLRKGYRLRERLIRPASVVVARKPAA